MQLVLLSCNLKKAKSLKQILFLVFLLAPYYSYGQTYTSYFTGSNTDIVTTPQGGICLMGGATESDQAMRWFLQRANGGDILVLRASGSNGYNTYLYSDLGINVNSVESIVCHSAAASNESYIIQKINQAEAIWFAGGDQWKYISYWRNSPIGNAINNAIQQRNIVIGGTSAGMAIMGQYYFSAQNGTVTSGTALADPYSNAVTVDSATFLRNLLLKNIITDTHFDNPDRKGRLVTFLARIMKDYGVAAKAIACDEYTAVCIDTDGIARVFGDYPTHDDIAYFIQPNCELSVQAPELCSAGSPLTWNLGGVALKAYQIKGDTLGSKTFDLNNWQVGNGGQWYHQYVSNGMFNEQVGTAINCPALSVNTFSDEVEIFPNPTSDYLNIISNNSKINSFFIINGFGQKITLDITQIGNSYQANLSNLQAGVYFMIIEEAHKAKRFARVIKY